MSHWSLLSLWRIKQKVELCLNHTWQVFIEDHQFLIDNDCFFQKTFNYPTDSVSVSMTRMIMK